METTRVCPGSSGFSLMYEIYQLRPPPPPYCTALCVATSENFSWNLESISKPKNSSCTWTNQCRRRTPPAHDSAQLAPLAVPGSLPCKMENRYPNPCKKAVVDCIHSHPDRKQISQDVVDYLRTPKKRVYRMLGMNNCAFGT